MSDTRKLILVGASALLVAGLAGCASSTDPELVAEADPDRIICKSAPNTGSRLKKRDCKTAKQWDDIAAATDQVNDAVRQRDTIRPGAVSDSSAKQN